MLPKILIVLHQEHSTPGRVGRLLREPGADYRPHGLPGVPELQVVYDYSYDGAMRSLEESFARLKLDIANL